jgi:cell division protein FtsL
MSNKKKRKKRSGIINYIMGGRVFISDVITRNALLLALIVLYAFIYVSNHYEYEQEILNIDRLTKRRDEMKNNLLTMKSEFSYKSRQTEIEKLLYTKNSELQISTKPRFKIKKDAIKQNN